MASRNKTLRGILEIDPVRGQRSPTWLWVFECKDGFEFRTPCGKSSFVREMDYDKAVRISQRHWTSQP